MRNMGRLGYRTQHIGDSGLLVGLVRYTGVPRDVRLAHHADRAACVVDDGKTAYLVTRHLAHTI